MIFELFDDTTSPPAFLPLGEVEPIQLPTLSRDERSGLKDGGYAVIKFSDPQASLSQIAAVFGGRGRAKCRLLAVGELWAFDGVFTRLTPDGVLEIKVSGKPTREARVA